MARLRARQTEVINNPGADADAVLAQGSASSSNSAAVQTDTPQDAESAASSTTPSAQSETAAENPSPAASTPAIEPQLTADPTQIDALAASAPQPHAYKHTTRYGDADVSLDWLCSQPQTSAVLHRAQPSQLLLRPLLVVVSQIGVEHAAELEYRHARPVPMVEELEAPMYVNSLFSPEISARHRILPGTERSSGGRSQRSLPFGIRR